MARRLQTSLANLGYTVVGVAASGQEAVEQGALLRPDIVVMDVGLRRAPGGLTAAQFIGARLDLPVVYLAGRRPVPDEVLWPQAETAGVYGYVVEPFGEPELRAAVEMALRAHQLQKRNEALAALNAVAVVVSQSLDLEEILEAALREVMAVLYAEGGLLYLFDETRQTFIPAVHRGISQAMLQEVTGFKMGIGLSGWVAESGEALVVADLSADPRNISPTAVQEGWHSYAGVPIQCKGRVFGVMTLMAHPVGHFGPDHVSLLSHIGRQVGVAIENARLHRETQRELAARKQAEEALRRRTAQLEVLRQMSLEITSQLNVNALLRSVVSRAVELLEGDAGDLHLYQPDRHVLKRYIMVDRFMTPGEIILHRGEGLAGKVWETGAPLIVEDYRRWEGRAPAYQPYPIATVVGVPVRWGGEFLGVLDVWANAPHVFSQADADLLEMFAAQAAVALKNARLYQAEREQFRHLQESQARLVQAEKTAALGRLVASVAHEINNPLQAVVGHLELAIEDLEGDPRWRELKESLELASDEADRIAILVRRMRELYEPAHQKLQPTDVHIVLESALELAAAELRRSRVAVERDWAAGLPMVLAHPANLKQVFVDLTLHAVDMMEKQGGTLRVRTALDQLAPDPQAEAAGQGRPAVRIEFSDTGEGLPVEELAHVFDPAIVARQRRTSLGLFISRGVVELYGGQVTATSEPGQGTTLTIRLPAA